MTPTAVCRHFANKDGLLAAQGFEALTAPTRRALEQPGAQALRACGQAYLAFAAADPALYRLMFGRGGRFPDAPELDAAAAACFDSLRQAVRRALPADTPSELPATLMAWSLVHGYASLRNDGLLARLPPEHWPSPADALLRLVGGDASQPTGPSTRSE